MWSAKSAAQTTKQEIEMPAAYVGNEPGERYKHEGAVCERPGAVGVCHLDPQYRHGLIEDLDTFIPTAIGSYQTALQNARIDELLKKAPQLGLVAELLIGAVGVVGGALLSSAATLAIKELNRRGVWNGAMKPDDFETAVTTQSNHMKNVLSEVSGIAKGRAKLAFTGATPQSQAKESFLRELQNDIGPLLHDILNNVKDTGDDLALVVAAKLFSPKVFTVKACFEHISGMIDRLEKQNLDDVGPDKSGVSGAAVTQVVRLHSFGQHRLAVLKFAHRVKLGRSYGEDWYTQEGKEFVNWVDDDFGEFAAGLQESRNGAMTTIDVSFYQDRFGPEVKAWVDRTRKGAAR
ncbi:MAG: hypothetical protein HOV81_14950 [Kofleriaceae bacterium]|nr:hypothetical protein [Kofleriaceae bacterium]